MEAGRTGEVQSGTKQGAAGENGADQVAVPQKIRTDPQGEALETQTDGPALYRARLVNS